MKTKKTAKILSVVLTLAILVCSLSVISGFVTTAVTNSEESNLIDNLKTKWQSLYTNETIANFPIDNPFMYLQINTYNNFTQNPNDEWVNSFSFDAEAGTFNKTTTSSTNYNRALAFRVSDGKLFNKDLSNNAFNNAFSNNDSLYFTFNPGTVKASGNLLVILQYTGYGDQYALCAEVPFTAGDNEIHIEKLTYRCPNSSYTGVIPTFSKLSDILNQFNGKDLHSVRIMFDKDVHIEGATISALQGAKYATLPEGNAEFTALEWYNAAKKLDVKGYNNADAFNTALTALETYLTENDPDFLVSELENAWQSLSINSSIANSPLTLPYMQNQMNLPFPIDDTSTDTFANTFTFNENGTFNKTPTSQTTYARGLLFNVNTSTKELFTSDSSTFSNAFNNNDSLYFTFNPGTVNASGNLMVVLQYNAYGTAYLLYAEVPVNVGDTGDKKIEIEKLTYKCADSSNYPSNYTFTQLSKMLTSPAKSSTLSTVKIMFDKDVNIEAATISGLKGAKYAVLPDGNGSFKPLDWYNAAKKLDVNGYENANAFNTALNNLKTYLSENDPNFLVSELKESWGKLSRDVSIAELNTNVLTNQTTNDTTRTPGTIGITFKEDNTFDKVEYNASTAVGGEYQKFGLVFSKNDSNGNKKNFDSNINSTDNNSFNNAFSDNSLYFTFNPGEVTAAGEMYVILQYNENGASNILYATVSINTTDKNTEQNIVINDLEFKNYDKKLVVSHTNLSDLLTYTNTNSETKNLFTIKVMFNRLFATTGASISELKTVKTETVPSDTDSNELISGKSLRVDTGFYGENANDFIANKEKLYNKLTAGKTLGNVNDIDNVDICDLVALKNLGYENDDTYKLIADMNTDGYITEADKTALISNILNQ